MTSERADSFSDVQCIGLRFQPHRNAAHFGDGTQVLMLSIQLQGNLHLRLMTFNPSRMFVGFTLVKLSIVSLTSDLVRCQLLLENNAYKYTNSTSMNKIKTCTSPLIWPQLHLDPYIDTITLFVKTSYMEGSVSATIKLGSPS